MADGMEQHDLRFISWAMQDNAPAIQFVNDVCYVAHLWDDLIDKDRDRGDDDINWAFWLLFVQIQENQFYAAHVTELVPVIRESILAWLESVEMEKRPGNSRCMAYTLRTLYNMIITTCAYLIGGYDWMRTVSGRMRADDSMTDGSFANYMQEMEKRYGK